MSLETQIAALVQASNQLTAAVDNKIGEIDKKVSDATEQVDLKIRQQFDVTFYVSAAGDDLNDGLSAKAPLKTIASALSSHRSPAGARVGILMLTDIRVSEETQFTNKHVFIENSGKTLTLSARQIIDTNGVNAGTGIYRIQGRGQNSSLVIHGGSIVTGDCVSSGNGSDWWFNYWRTAIQMGGIDYDSGFFPVVLNGVTVTLGRNVVGLSSGGNGANVYPGQGVVCATLYAATINATAQGAVDIGYGVHFVNNSLRDANGKVVQTVA